MEQAQGAINGSIVAGSFQSGELTFHGGTMRVLAVETLEALQQYVG